MEFLEFMNKDLITLLKSTQKTEAIIEMATIAGEQGIVDDVDDLTQKLFYREQLMSTGLGLGIGIPHVRYNDLKTPGVLMGIQKKGIADYQSIDNIPVKLIFMIILKEGDQKLHLRLLSQIVQRLKEPQLVDELINAEDCNAALDIISLYNRR